MMLLSDNPGLDEPRNLCSYWQHLPLGLTTDLDLSIEFSTDPGPNHPTTPRPGVFFPIDGFGA